MDEVYKVLQPSKYLREFISRKIRPDGRKFEECCPVMVHPNTITTADGSCMVIADTTKVYCGIKAELTKPTTENPSAGFVVVNLELPALCSPLFKCGPPGDLAQTINKLVSDIFKDSKCVNLNELCVSKEKLVWVVYCDLVCINFGGSVIDASIMALITALKTLRLPVVEYNAASENCIVHEDKKVPLNILNFPIATTFATFEGNIMLVNPTYEEEEQCGGPLGGTIIVWGFDTCAEKKNEKEILYGVHQLGCSPVSQEYIQKAIDIAKKRSTQLRELINTALNSNKTI